MVRQAATVRALTQWSGIIVTVVSAVLLGLVFWQISRLDAFGGLSPSAMERDRLAVRAGGDLAATWEAISDFRTSLVLGDIPMRTDALRSVIDSRMRALDVLFGKGGPAADFDSDGDWPDAQKAWATLRKAGGGPSALPLFVVLSRHIDSLLYDLDGNSGLNYDNAATQNLAQVVFEFTPEASDRVHRAVVQAVLAIRNGGMSLKERLAFSGAVNGVQSDFDLSSNDIPGVVKMLTTLMPARAKEFAEILPLAKRYEAAGKPIYKLLYDQVLFRVRPTIDPKVMDAAAAPAVLAAQELTFRLFRATDAMVVERGRIYNERRTYLYVALLLGALLLVGLMLVIAQIVAFRSSQAL